MKAVAVACGGKGTRLGVAGQKCLVEVAGRPFLAWKLDQLVERGADELHLLVSHRAGDVVELVGAQWEGIPVRYHHDDGIGAWEAADRAAEHMPFAHWFTYGDVLVDYPLRESMFPYIIVTTALNGEEANYGSWLDAGLYHRWGKCRRFIPKFIKTPTVQINTPDALRDAHAALAR